MSETPRPVVRSFAHLSDEAVVALLARSDESALAELYDRFGRVAYGLALRILRDDKLAEDALTEIRATLQTLARVLKQAKPASLAAIVVAVADPRGIERPEKPAARE